MGSLTRDTEAQGPVGDVESNKDNWKHNPRILVNITASHAKYCTGRIENVGVNLSMIVRLLMMVMIVHGGHQRQLIMMIVVVRISSCIRVVY